MTAAVDRPMTSLEFARMVQHLAREARALGLVVPGFRATPHQRDPLVVGHSVSIRTRTTLRASYRYLVDGLVIYNEHQADANGERRTVDPEFIQALHDAAPEWIP